MSSQGEPGITVEMTARSLPYNDPAHIARIHEGLRKAVLS